MQSSTSTRHVQSSNSSQGTYTHWKPTPEMLKLEIADGSRYGAIQKLGHELLSRDERCSLEEFFGERARGHEENTNSYFSKLVTALSDQNYVIRDAAQSTLRDFFAVLAPKDRRTLISRMAEKGYDWRGGFPLPGSGDNVGNIHFN